MSDGRKRRKHCQLCRRIGPVVIGEHHMPEPRKRGLPGGSKELRLCLSCVVGFMSKAVLLWNETVSP